ncbi:MAG: metallophosphoesterase [Chloroflexota bacterium]|nr:metallophosphoesterase [Chloroflexota bacterium]
MPEHSSIPTIKAGDGGHHFVIYSDSCSGLPGTVHEENFRRMNALIAALDQAPQFICFPGDEIMGLTTDRERLRRQWAYFFERELSWLDRAAVPVYHGSGNHTVYDRTSETIFRETMAHHPENGPPDQRGLSYFLRRGDLLMIFVNTLWSGTGGEGTVETEWLEATLTQHADAGHKLVFGHHPVWTVNGYAGDYQRNLERDNGRRFWDALTRHGALAYVCSHILAFDAQVHGGVLQICSAGAGTAHRMPPEDEYLHIVQAALDDDGLRYQVLDRAGQVREWLRWPWTTPASESWAPFCPAAARSLPADCLGRLDKVQLVLWQISGELPATPDGAGRMILRADAEDDALPWFWLGASGVDNRLTALLSPRANRSPHRWTGPPLPQGRSFSIQFALHSGMGPGGLLWRWSDEEAWSSLIGASAWGAERIPWSHSWRLGENLRLRWRRLSFELCDLLN